MILEVCLLPLPYVDESNYAQALGSQIVTLMQAVMFPVMRIRIGLHLFVFLSVDIHRVHLTWLASTPIGLVTSPTRRISGNI